MSNDIPYPMAIQVVLLHKLKLDPSFDVSNHDFDFSAEFKFVFAERTLEKIPAPWTLEMLLHHSEISMHAYWERLASRRYIHSVTSSAEPQCLWGVSEAGMVYLQKLEAQCNNPVFLRDMSAVFQKLLVKLVDLDAVQKEWSAVSDQLGEVTETDIAKKLQEHMTDLHRLNEFKDIAQSIIGQLAAKTGKTMREMYEELEIKDEEDA